MTWTQVYNPLGSIWLSAAVAAIPLFILLYMLGVRRAKGHYAATGGLIAALAVAIAVWGMPAGLAVNSTLMGAAFGFFPIIWIIICAIWVYNMTVESGQFEVIKNSLASITDDRRLQALFIAFAFGSFIEGASGFGTPIAITAAMLVGLGFNPVYACGICLLANTAPVAYGAVGTPVITAAAVSGLDLMHISKIVGRQLPFLSIIVPLWLVVLMCGWKRSLEVLPAIIVSGVAFAGTQFFTSNYVNAFLPDITSAIVTIAALLVFLKIWHPEQSWHFPDEAASTTGKEELRYSLPQVALAWSPYLILTVLVFLWADDQYLGFRNVLDGIDKTLPFYVFAWPGLDGLIMKAAPIVAKAAPYAAKFKLNPLGSTGTAILVTGIITMIILPKYSFGQAVKCFFKTIAQLAYPIYTVMCILGIAFLMNYAGMSSSLGLAFTTTGFLFPFFAPILGMVGVFLTGSDTSSNALFSTMQRTTAEQLGLDPNLMVAANSSGGVCGKMISPQSISVATAATGLVGHEGDIFRFTLWHSVAMTLFMSLLTFLQAYALHWMLP